MSDRAIDLTIMGGVPPCIYAWPNEATIQDVADVAAGTYTVTDAQGCADGLTVTIVNFGPKELALSRPAPNPTRGPVQFRYGSRPRPRFA